MVNRHFGVEFEFSNSWKQLRELVVPVVDDVCGSNRVYAKNYKFKSLRKLDCWHVKVEDDNISELTTPKLCLGELSQVCRVMRVLGKTGCLKAEKSNGLHVHVEVKRDYELRSLAALWLCVEKTMFKMVPRSRMFNDYCARVVGKEWRSNEVIANVNDAYDTMISYRDNALSLTGCYGTNYNVEFRLAQSTCDSKYIRAWVTLCVKLVELASFMKSWDFVGLKVNSYDFRKLSRDIGLSKSCELTLSSMFPRA